VTAAAITTNLMRNNSFRVDSVQKLLGAQISRQADEAGSRSGQKLSGPLSARLTLLLLLFSLLLLLL